MIYSSLNESREGWGVRPPGISTIKKKPPKPLSHQLMFCSINQIDNCGRCKSKNTSAIRVEHFHCQ
jgi:hypothetical protein